MADRFDSLFAAIDRFDPDAFAAHLTDDVEFVYGSGEPVRGRDAVRAHVAGFFAAFEGIEHAVDEVWRPAPEVAVLEGRVRYRRAGLPDVRVPFVNVLRMRDGAIHQYRIYVDPSPLAASSPSA